ncbi:MAG: hypothetical protein ACYC1C_09790 [Chloroflexota bacterium]
MRRLDLAKLVFVIGAVLAFMLAAESAYADGTPQGAPTVLNVKEQSAAKSSGRVVLSATLTTPDGQPLNNLPVKFYQEVDLLGSREAYLGTATTNATGTATLSFQSSEQAKPTVKVRFEGNDGYVAAQAVFTLSGVQAASPFVAEVAPLAPVGRWLTNAALAAVLAVGLLLLGILLSTAHSIRASAGRSQLGWRLPIRVPNWHH